jgi:hypothetical protein
MNEITPEEKKQFFFFWMTQRKAIEGRVSEQTMHWFNIYTDKDNVGYEFGQLRPGKLGQWDLYWALTSEQSIGCDENETLIASGLTVVEVAEAKRREHYRELCVDPDDQLAIAEFEKIQSMSPEQLDSEITRLQNQLTEGMRIPA